MSNYLDNIKLIASELANMSPKTQLEIVKLCKNICLNVKDYLVELDEQTIDEIETDLTNLENELSVAEGNITANANAITIINNTIDTINTALSNRYTKAEVDALLDAKVDKSNVGFVELSAETSTGTLTDAQYNETLKRFCIIKFGVGELFYKARNQWFTKLDYTLTEMSNYLIIKYDDIIVNNDKTWYRGDSRSVQLYNTSQINTLLSDKFDKSNIGWIELNNESGTLPDSDYNATLKKYCFIKYNDDLYYKTSETASYIDFYYVKTLCDTNANDCTIYSKYIRITKSTKAYETNTTTPVHFYNKAQTDALTLLENIKDSHGNNRFVEGHGTNETISGVTFTYSTWSLSGTHLMLVLAGSITDATTIAGQSRLTTFYLPDWVISKITPTVGPIVDYKTITLYGSDYSSQTVQCYISLGVDRIGIVTNSNLTTTKDRTFRIQFDLLIDNSN